MDKQEGGGLFILQPRPLFQRLIVALGPKNNLHALERRFRARLRNLEPIPSQSGPVHESGAGETKSPGRKEIGAENDHVEAGRDSFERDEQQTVGRRILLISLLSCAFNTSPSFPLSSPRGGGVLSNSKSLIGLKCEHL